VCALAALLALALACAHARSRSLDRPFREASDADADESAPGEAPILRDLVRTVRAHPALLGWLAVATVADLLDEAMVAFASAHLAAFTGASDAERMVAIGAWVAGDLAGALLLPAALARVRPLRLLQAAALVATAALGALLLTRSSALAAVALAALGAASITFHPLLMARAYAALPGRPALVGACGALFGPASVASPLALGLLAGAWGTSAAIAALALAPLLVALAAWRAQSQLLR
jgi:hypothetical protein